MKKNIIALGLLTTLSVQIFWGNIAFASTGDNALFTLEPLNGKAGENEVKVMVNTDSAAINHLIFEIANLSPSTLVFNLDGSGDPISLPLTGQSVLGTSMTFTTASNRTGYDLASANPASTSAYSALNAAILTADRNLPTGQGGTLGFGSDTAIYYNAQRQGIIGGNYTVLPNVAPIISSPTIGGIDPSQSITIPTSQNPIPEGLMQDVSVRPTIAYSVTDSTDASVSRTIQIYKRLSNGSWGYSANAELTRTSSRSGTSMTFSSQLGASEALDFATYYKIQLVATDDQGASDTKTYYFSTESDNSAPTQVSKAAMTFLGESDTRSNVIAQISFSGSSDNDSLSSYYLWTKSYLVAKNILDSDGDRNLALDQDNDGTISDEEFYQGLRTLVENGNYLSEVDSTQALVTPYFRITGTEVDGEDDEGIYYTTDSLAEEILYVVSSDTSTNVSGTSVPNFGNFKIVSKEGDVFGSEVEVSVGGSSYDYIVGDGSLNVWDVIYLYRNIVGQASEYPVVKCDTINDEDYAFPTNITTHGATETGAASSESSNYSPSNYGN